MSWSMSSGGDWPCEESWGWALSSQPTDSITFLRRDTHWQTDRQTDSLIPAAGQKTNVLCGSRVPHLCPPHQLTSQRQEAVHDRRQEQPMKSLRMFARFHPYTTGTDRQSDEQTVSAHSKPPLKKSDFYQETTFMCLLQTDCTFRALTHF